MKDTIRHTFFFEHSLQTVWDYLTKPELIEQWLMKNDFQPIVGHKFRFTFIAKNDSTYEGVVDCEVLEVKAFTKLSYSWNGKTQDHSRDFHSTVVWTLEPKENGTELHLSHNGFSMLEDILTHKSGWENCLKKMLGSINHTKK